MKKKEKSYGEDALVERLVKQLPEVKQNGVVVGIGDDCAAVRGGKNGELMLLKTDSVVEGRHFVAETNPSDVGWKAVCRAVSDIGACGGEPRWALIACAIREDQQDMWLTQLYRGIARASREFGFDVVGGELVRTQGEAVITVSMTGAVAERELVRRGTGRVGDVLYVTGVLGGSLASGWHLKFRPRLAQARWLVSNFRVRAMMDLSDGLASDLPRMAAASGCGFAIDASLLPRRRGVSVESALSDGEDFELLFAVSVNDIRKLEAAWEKRWPKVRLTRIGRLAEVGECAGLGELHGYDHFGKR